MSAYIGDVVKNGLVLYLDAANSKSYVSGSSTWFDLSGNNNNASLVGVPSYNTDNKGTLTFSRTSVQYGETPTISSIANWTAESWVKFTTVPSTNSTVSSLITNVFNGSNLNFSLTTDIDGTANKGIYAAFFNGAWRAAGPHVPSAGVWYQYCGTYDGTTIRLYVNGNLFSSTSYTGTAASGGAIRIARRWDSTAVSGNVIDGVLPVARVYNRALSAAEILENYNATKGRFDTPRAINSVQPRLVTNGLVMSLDAGNRKSYSGTGTEIYNLAASTSMTFCGTVAENGTITFNAPPGYIFSSVEFASFGTPNGSCGAFTTSSCHSTSSYSYVAGVIIGKTGSVSIAATNANFGDPCGGQVKRLYIQATATASYATGSLINGPTFNSSNNGNIVFDGSNDYGSIRPPLPEGQDKYTLSAWWRTSVNNRTQVIYEQNTSTLVNSRRGAILQLNANWGFNGESNDAHDKVPVRLNQWTNGTIVIEENAATNKVKIYENGVLYWQGNSTNNASNLNLGADVAGFGRKLSANSEYFVGNIAQINVYNRVLSDAEILQNYNATKGRFGL